MLEEWIDFAYRRPQMSKNLPAGLKRLREIDDSGEFVYHGSGKVGIKQFEPNLPDGEAIGPDGIVYDLNPLVFATANVELAMTVAVSRNGDLPGLGWVNVELRQGRIATIFAYSTDFEPNPVPISLQTAIDGSIATATVYVFEKRLFNTDFPVAGEWISTQTVTPTEEVQLTAEDAQWVVENITPFSSLLPFSRSLLKMEQSELWLQGGHLQYEDQSGKLLERISPNSGDLQDALERNRQLVRQLATGYPWGNIRRSN